MATYETKKQQCAERMIPFEFTKEEWEIFNTIKSEVTLTRKTESDYYNHTQATPHFDIVGVLQKHYSGLNFGNMDQHVFSCPPQFARFLLHNLKHGKLTERDIKTASYVTSTISKGEMKDSWPKAPIVIQGDSGTIVNGVKRLYALGEASQGCHMWIEIVLGDDYANIN